MATVDFTLEDIGNQTQQIIDQSLSRAFEREREFTKQFVQETVSHELMNFWDQVLEPAFDDIHSDIAEIKHSVRHLTRVVNQHTKDIMDIRSRLA